MQVRTYDTLHISPQATGHCTTENDGQALQVDQGYLSQPETIAFPTTGGKTAYMNHYPPANKDFQLPGKAP